MVQQWFSLALASGIGLGLVSIVTCQAVEAQSLGSSPDPVQPEVQDPGVDVTPADPSAPDPVLELAQGVTGPELDDSLADLKATFTQIEAIQVPNFALGSPAYTIAVPAGYGVGYGSVYAVAGGVFERRVGDSGQAGIGVGFGLGDPVNWVGVDLNYLLADVEEGLGGFSVSAHRALVSNDQVGWSLAVGWEDLITTGDFVRDSSVYGSTSAVIKLRSDVTATFSRLALTLGVGGGRFRTEEDIEAGRDGVGAFGSVALRVTRSVSVITEWTGQDLAAGVSFAPIPDVNFYITPSVRDLAGAGDEVRFSLSSGILFDF